VEFPFPFEINGRDMVSRLWGFVLVLRQVGFESLRKFTPREHDAPAAAFALEADVRTQTRDGPLIGAARMLLSQAEMVVETQVG
jgi:hypothetical protein